TGSAAVRRARAVGLASALGSLGAVFSRRTRWDQGINRLTERLTAKRRAGVRILDLTLSNPTQAQLEYPADQILAALGDGRALRYEPTPLGAEPARRAVADYYAARGATVDPGAVVLTASTSEAYSFLFKLLADAGDVVLVPQPSYPLFDFLATLEG